MASAEFESAPPQKMILEVSAGISFPLTILDGKVLSKAGTPPKVFTPA
jgi:hypothetical protein